MQIFMNHSTLHRIDVHLLHIYIWKLLHQGGSYLEKHMLTVQWLKYHFINLIKFSIMSWIIKYRSCSDLMVFDLYPSWVMTLAYLQYIYLFIHQGFSWHFTMFNILEWLSFAIKQFKRKSFILSKFPEKFCWNIVFLHSD